MWNHRVPPREDKPCHNTAFQSQPQGCGPFFSGLCSAINTAAAISVNFSLRPLNVGRFSNRSEVWVFAVDKIFTASDRLRLITLFSTAVCGLSVRHCKSLCKEKLCAGDFKSEVTKEHKAQKLHFIYAHDPLSSSRERKKASGGLLSHSTFSGW